jgi:hypothetical protein
VGLKSPKHSGEKRDKKGRKKRKPTVRAMTLASKLQKGRSEAQPAPEKTKLKPTEPQQAVSQKRG